MRCIATMTMGRRVAVMTGFGTIFSGRRNIAYLNPTKEMPSLVSNSQSRPADVYIANWVDGRKIAFDVSVVSPTQDAILHRAADTTAAAIEMRKSSKMRAHFDNCHGQGITFQPLVVETFGRWDLEAVKLFKDIARLRL